MENFIERLIQACLSRKWEEVEHLIQDPIAKRALGWHDTMTRPPILSDVLIWAARNGHLAVVNRLLEAEDVDVRAGYNNAICWAARNGHLAVVDHLLRAGADASVDDNHPICSAVERGHRAVVDHLLRAGADATARDNNPIRSAAQRGDLDLVNLLLRAGADAMVAILLAANHGHLAVVNSLIEAEDVDVRAGYLNAIRAAAQEGHLAVVDRLLRAGADATALKNVLVRAAAQGGHLAVVSRLLRESTVVDAGVPAAALTCFERANKLDLLCWDMFENPVLRKHVADKHSAINAKVLERFKEILKPLKTTALSLYVRGLPHRMVIKILADTIADQVLDPITCAGKIFSSAVRRHKVSKLATAARAKLQAQQRLGQGEASPLPAGAPVTPAREAAGSRRRPASRPELVEAQAASSGEGNRPADNSPDDRPEKGRNRGKSP